MNAALTFFEENSAFNTALPQIPEELITDEEIAKWVFKQDIPYIELDLSLIHI